jgi:peptidoglycan/LPS O-acetylase OafA/YrhL
MIQTIRQLLLQPFTDTNRKVSSKGFGISSLDGVRGLAVLIVVASHTAAFWMHGQGSIGVLLFFILSGYVLTIPFVHTPAKITTELGRFYINRILRVVPAYIVTVLIITLLKDESLIWFLHNASFIAGWNHLWSVAEEARFYLLFPLVLLILAVFKSDVLRMGVVVLLIILFYNLHDYHRINMLSQGRHIGFYFWMFLGGMLGCLVARSEKLKPFFSSAFTRISLTFLSWAVVASVLLASNKSIRVIWNPLLGVPEKLFQNVPLFWLFSFVILIITMTVYSKSSLARVFSSYPLRHFGILSYGIYLFHMPIFINIYRYYGFGKEKLFVVVLLLSYLAAYLSYVFVEKPFLKLKPGKKN